MSWNSFYLRMFFSCCISTWVGCLFNNFTNGRQLACLDFKQCCKNILYKPFCTSGWVWLWRDWKWLFWVEWCMCLCSKILPSCPHRGCTNVHFTDCRRREPVSLQSCKPVFLSIIPSFFSLLLPWFAFPWLSVMVSIFLPALGISSGVNCLFASVSEEKIQLHLTKRMMLQWFK